MHKAVGYVLLLIIGLAIGVSVGIFALVPQTPNLDEQVKVTIKKITCTHAEGTAMQIVLENNVPERSLKGNVIVYQDEKQWTSEVKWYFTGEGTAEIICDSINETRNFRVKYVENDPKATYLDRIIEWDEVGIIDDFTFMKTEELSFTSYTWDTASPPNWIKIKVQNTGSADISISAIQVNGVNANGTDPSLATAYTLPPGSEVTFTVTHTYTSGVKYEFTVVTANGNIFGPYIKTAP